MDEEYIIMCKEATEIQELWKPKEFDLYLFEDKDTREGFIDCCPVYLGRKWDGDIEGCKIREQDIEVYKDLCVWLPRQEDIQEILLDKRGDGAGDIINDFYFFIVDNEPLPYVSNREAISMFWLVFIMATLYQKKWDSENKKWVSL